MLERSDFRVVIKSRKRVESCQHAATLVPSAVICVAAEEAAEYAWAGDRLVLHPDDVTGIGPLNRWVLAHFKERCVVAFDDDVKACICLVGRRARKITDPVAIEQILYNAAVIADGMGISVFGFATTPNLLDFVPHDPFGVVRAPGPVQGFVGRRVQPDPELLHNTDADLTLQALLLDRFVWQDNRFSFEHSFQSNVGGGTHLHSKADYDRYIRHLRKKWGTPGLYWDVVESGGKTRTVVRVRRRQTLEV